LAARGCPLSAADGEFKVYREPVVAWELLWTVVSNGEATARFHKSCHAEWLAEQEVASRRALGIKP
jgi:hypothetical protein